MSYHVRFEVDSFYIGRVARWANEVISCMGNHVQCTQVGHLVGKRPSNARIFVILHVFLQYSARSMRYLAVGKFNNALNTQGRS